MPGRLRFLLLVSAACGLRIAPASPASAQESQPAPEEPAAGAASAPAPGSGGPVDISLESFGVGDRVRPGDWAGVRLSLVDNASDKPRPVAVRIHTLDDDGDTLYTTRRITLNPGKSVGTWLYLRLAKDTVTGTTFEVSVNSVDPQVAAGVENPGAGIGELIVSRRFTPRGVLDGPEYAMIAAVGGRSLGLEQYAMRTRSGNKLGTSNEVTELVPSLTPASMPDAWIGLEPFEAILWSGADVDALEPTRAAAVREWVHRGGHLLVVLPPVGNVWFSASNPLLDIMPRVAIERHENASFVPYLPLLASPNTPPPDRATLLVQTFTPEQGASAAEATQVLSSADGCIVARRLVGAGMVSVVGLDIQEAIHGLPAGAFRADYFWHRIIGERFDLPRDTNAVQLGGLGGSVVWVDAFLGREIAKQRAAGLGVLLGLGVFAAYWIIAAPGSFALLRRRGLVRHAWATFFTATLAFTLIAWAGASSIRPRRVDAQHLTYLDHVYGQSVERARTWASVLLPTYSNQRVSVGDPGQDQSWRQAMAVWSDPSSNATPTPFPDARGYTYDVQHLESMRVPSRATVKQFQMEWLGGPRWSMPAPASKGDEPRLVRRQSGIDLLGKLTHALPGPLVDTTVVLVEGQSPLGRGQEEDALKEISILPSRAFAWKNVGADGRWEPGVALDLALLKPEEASRAEQYLGQALVPRSEFGITERVFDERIEQRYHAMAAFYPMLAQPEYDKTTATQALVQRQSVHGMDLGKWFTQPCLIVVGSLVNAPSPTPIYVDGVEAPSSGRTVVRWVYPLPPDPPVIH